MADFSYIHIPFCKQKCKYCAFTSFVNLNSTEKYTETLCFEIEKAFNNDKKVPQKGIYIGGGTPSLFTINQINKILEKIPCSGEATLEVNPENANKNYFSDLLNMGINRLSIGVQSFDDEILRTIGRNHLAKDAVSAVKKAYDAGFSNVSIDLMYGLPNQTLKLWENTLKFARNLGVEHISAYGLKIEENTYFGKFLPKNLPDDDMQAAMYYKTLEILDDYKQYEISNFAKSEKFISKHNLNYWQQGAYNGFGLAACGFDGKVRYKKTSCIKKYFENPFELEEKIKLSKKDALEEAIFLGFRLACGINISDINEKFGIDFNKKYQKILEKYIKTGHILETNAGYKLSIEGILISNYILADFLC